MTLRQSVERQIQDQKQIVRDLEVKIEEWKHSTIVSRQYQRTWKKQKQKLSQMIVALRKYKEKR